MVIFISQARLSVIPLRTGNLQITGIKYSLSSVTLSGPVDYINTKSAATTDHPAVSAVSVLGRLDIGVRGPRLNSSKIERSSVMYGEDNRLNIVIVKPMPRLVVSYITISLSVRYKMITVVNNMEQYC